MNIPLIPASFVLVRYYQLHVYGFIDPNGMLHSDRFGFRPDVAYKNSLVQCYLLAVGLPSGCLITTGNFLSKYIQLQRKLRQSAVGKEGREPEAQLHLESM